jgi:hypothetical protein
MRTTLLALTLILTAASSGPSAQTQPKHSPYAPSLPYLTPEEEKKLDDVIDRFMQFDIGQLKGEEGRKAQRAFDKLGPEAIPALIRGLNRAARIDHSCPALTISRKLRGMLLASKDTQLLEFARDEIGAGVGRSRYSGMLQDLRVACMLRKNALARATPTGPKTPRTMTVTELVEAVSNTEGARLKQVLTELEQRRGKEALTGLSLGARHSDRDVRRLSRDLLDRHLARQTAALVKEKLKDTDAEIRLAAVRTVAARHAALTGDVIDLLTDAEAEVRDAAHQALVRRARGEDLGPPTDASAKQRDEAQKKWRDWWERQRGKAR